MNGHLRVWRVSTEPPIEVMIVIKNQAGLEARKRKVGGEVQVRLDPDPVQDHGIVNLNVVVDHDRGQDRDHHLLRRKDLKNEVDIENKILNRQFL